MFELFFKIQILLRFYSTFSHFVSNFLDHPNIILKTKLSGIHNFEYNTKKSQTQTSSILSSFLLFFFSFSFFNTL
jgi:hypothetical protein